MAAKKFLVKTMLMSILTAAMMMSFSACSSDDDILMALNSHVSISKIQYVASERTVLVYLAGKNNLSECLQANLEQMKAGSRYIGNNTLLVFVRRDVPGEKPWLACISNGEMTEEKYHGVSMYIPQNYNTEHGKYYAQNNEDIKQLTWYQSVGW